MTPMTNGNSKLIFPFKTALTRCSSWVNVWILTGHSKISFVDLLGQYDVAQPSVVLHNSHAVRLAFHVTGTNPNHDTATLIFHFLCWNAVFGFHRTSNTSFKPESFILDSFVYRTIFSICLAYQYGNEHTTAWTADCFEESSGHGVFYDTFMLYIYINVKCYIQTMSLLFCTMRVNIHNTGIDHFTLPLE